MNDSFVSDENVKVEGDYVKFDQFWFEEEKNYYAAGGRIWFVENCGLGRGWRLFKVLRFLKLFTA